jgi:hypothetical protein
MPVSLTRKSHRLAMGEGLRSLGSSHCSRSRPQASRRRLDLASRRGARPDNNQSSPILMHTTLNAGGRVKSINIDPPTLDCG